MTTIEALKQENIRISNGDRWLIYENNEWKILERKSCMRYTKEIISTLFEEEAIKYLLNEEEN